MIMYQMLTGRHPVRPGSFEYICRQINFPIRRPQYISDLAWDLLSGFLCINPKQRPSAAEALHHPFITQSVPPALPQPYGTYQFHMPDSQRPPHTMYDHRYQQQQQQQQQQMMMMQQRLPQPLPQSQPQSHPQPQQQMAILPSTKQPSQQPEALSPALPTQQTAKPSNVPPPFTPKVHIPPSSSPYSPSTPSSSPSPSPLPVTHAHQQRIIQLPQFTHTNVPAPAAPTLIRGQQPMNFKGGIFHFKKLDVNKQPENAPNIVGQANPMQFPHPINPAFGMQKPANDAKVNKAGEARKFSNFIPYDPVSKEPQLPQASPKAISSGAKEVPISNSNTSNSPALEKPQLDTAALKDSIASSWIVTNSKDLMSKTDSQIKAEEKRTESQKKPNEEGKKTNSPVVRAEPSSVLKEAATAAASAENKDQQLTSPKTNATNGKTSSPGTESENQNKSLNSSLERSLNLDQYEIVTKEPFKKKEEVSSGSTQTSASSSSSSSTPSASIKHTIPYSFSTFPSFVEPSCAISAQAVLRLKPHLVANLLYTDCISLSALVPLTFGSAPADFPSFFPLFYEGITGISNDTITKDKKKKFAQLVPKCPHPVLLLLFHALSHAPVHLMPKKEEKEKEKDKKEKVKEAGQKDEECYEDVLKAVDEMGGMREFEGNQLIELAKTTIGSLFQLSENKTQHLSSASSSSSSSSSSSDSLPVFPIPLSSLTDEQRKRCVVVAEGVLMLSFLSSLSKVNPKPFTFDSALNDNEEDDELEMDEMSGRGLGFSMMRRITYEDEVEDDDDDDDNELQTSSMEEEVKNEDLDQISDDEDILEDEQIDTSTKIILFHFSPKFFEKLAAKSFSLFRVILHHS
ncbi:uncharacterized protein MONOS_14167 [Monocercomonoides exilis]|uniref:uncharacterized protein n=1 Tax=Monocercomonoides exilis TaxID=2049356 RepID=UPI00355AC958|nr:hypothetical protein MONOS_14167 [Monocercomonoides exilis]|eukprot:MONOS_14167.1-p1 / transcript=MONOS_14167.1 / gene=MONOS_14167 / organism=Monocercomonoides_exilis_PA203 / gene_product=unspecified product / transcript_product=unspecified product / location=Mono_scaffold00949:15088-18122(-) / protein_length=855 / sequence_SO=supercontig / SO=protein_coding / is_pseudo=false